MGNIYGYICVSTREQNEDRQLLAMQGLNIPDKNIFIDKQSVRILKDRSTAKWCVN